MGTAADFENARYGITRNLGNIDFDRACESVRQALATQGFGVLTTIDVKQTLKTKLDVDVPPYVILGACNPPLAHKALQAEPAAGLLLPCNVVVAQQADGVVVCAIDPDKMFEVVGRPEIAHLAQQVRDKLTVALEQIAI